MSSHVNEIEEIKEIILKDKQLTDKSKKVISNISYDSILNIYKDLNNLEELDFFKLYDIVSTIMIFIENTKLNGKFLDGTTKKELVIHLGRSFLIYHTKNEQILDFYDKYVDTIIEKIIYNSVFLNVKSEIINKCCFF